jgi:hypothetical protein
MSIVAIMPVAQLSSANAALAAGGWGPFSVVAQTNGNPSHGMLHAWGPAAFITAAKALPGVVFDEGPGDPITRAAAMVAAAGAQWGDRAPNLPSTGNTQANTLYRFGDELWLSIVVFNRTTFSGPPSGLAQSIIRRARRPGEVLPWVQPIDQFDAYNLSNPFTGLPDQVTHSGKTWDCLIANNVSEPGVANWREYVAAGYPAWLQPTGAGDAYPVGFRVTHLGQNWRNTAPANVFAPGVAGWVVEP